jgi:hypothetical protein
MCRINARTMKEYSISHPARVRQGERRASINIQLLAELSQAHAPTYLRDHRFKSNNLHARLLKMLIERGKA